MIMRIIFSLLLYSTSLFASFEEAAQEIVDAGIELNRMKKILFFGQTNSANVLSH